MGREIGGLGEVARGPPVAAPRRLPCSGGRARRRQALASCRCRAAPLGWRVPRLDSSIVCRVFLDASGRLLPCLTHALALARFRLRGHSVLSLHVCYIIVCLWSITEPSQTLKF